MMPLLAAIKNSDIETVRQCLESGDDPCQLDSSGKLPVYEAAVKDDREINAAHRGAVDSVRVLIEHGATLEFAGKNSDRQREKG